MPSITSRRAEVQHPTQPPAAVSNDLAPMYRAVGLDERAAQIENVYARCGGFDAEAASSAVDLAAEWIRLVYALINGTMSAREAQAELNHVRTLAALDPTEMITAARRQHHYVLARTFWEANDQLVHELDDVVQAAVERVKDLALLAGGINSDAEAVRASAAAAAAWAALITEEQIIRTAWAIDTSLRVAELIDDVVDAGWGDWFWRYPELVDDDQSNDRHPVRRLLDRLDGQPTVRTATEVINHAYGTTASAA